MFHWFRKHTKDGAETPDPTPLEITLRQKPLTIAEQLARFVSNDEIKERLRAKGMDTFDEANDFDIPGDEPDDYPTMHEDRAFEAEMGVAGLQARLDEQKAGMAGDIPQERLNSIQERLNANREAKKKAETKAAIQ